MVPTLTCGLSRSNFSFATFYSLLYRLVCPPLWRRTSEIYLNAVVRESWCCCSAALGIRPCPRRLRRNRLPGSRFDDLLGDVRGNLVVALELHGVVGASLRVGAQVGCVAEHLAQGDLGGDSQRVAASLLAFHAPTPAAEVSDHVAEEVLGSDHLDREDRLEQNGLGPFRRLFEGEGACDFEGDFRGVHVVVLPVDEGDAHVHHRVARLHTVIERLFDPLLDSGDVFGGDVSPLDLVDELEAHAGGRLEVDEDHPELTGATGLADELPFDLLHAPAYRLAVGDLGATNVGLDPELSLHAVDEHLEVQLPIPEISVWPVSSLVRTWKVGSS